LAKFETKIEFRLKGGVSLPDVWRDRFLDKLKVWENENRQTSDLFTQNLKKKIEDLKIKINHLTDAYLEGTFELAEFQQKKNALTSEKKLWRKNYRTPPSVRGRGAIIGSNSSGTG
jgi:hypothetical protein